MNCWRRMSSSLVLLCIHILQIVWCETTVSPSCKPGENCTTTLMHTTESPGVGVMRIVECAADIRQYCVNGRCLYLLDEDEYYCRCEYGYRGLRCTDSDLVQVPANEEYLALTIFLTALLLLAVALVVFFAYKWYSLKKSSQPNQKYKEVGTQNL
ncbi:proepiregulin-like [Bufo bufo]|uniref:proepiregulin-like n=1 Tax=Bufo bufo TaxID=8384 RepID=UPI001ABE22BB|nr:proepiregulin-like [Bufo bufo]